MIVLIRPDGGPEQFHDKLLLAENRVSGQTTEYVNKMIAKYS